MHSVYMKLKRLPAKYQQLCQLYVLILNLKFKHRKHSGASGMLRNALTSAILGFVLASTPGSAWEPHYFLPFGEQVEIITP